AGRKTSGARSREHLERSRRSQRVSESEKEDRAGEEREEPLFDPVAHLFLPGLLEAVDVLINGRDGVRVARLEEKASRRIGDELHLAVVERHTLAFRVPFPEPRGNRVDADARLARE